MRDAMRPQSESHVRIADATDGRTDGTKNRIRSNMNLTTVDAGARDEIQTIGEVLADGPLWMTDERHPVIRKGQRDEIRPHVRAAVWFRDRGKCELCNAHTPEGQAWHLDHITPWSAGGSDSTTNLRVLCERHNITRSNRIDPTERPRRAATWWCLNCYDHESFGWDYGGPLPSCPAHGPISAHCRVLRAYRSAYEGGGKWPTWHHVEAVKAATVIAYCAHCDAPGLTDKPL